MQYLHSMIRVKDLDETLNFFCETLNFKEIRRYDSEAGKYTNVFLAASGDAKQAATTMAPVIELTYNWPDENGKTEDYSDGRNFGHLAFKVSNIYETCQRVQDSGVLVNRPPRDGKMAFFKTPDGVSIELLQEGDALAPEEPWSSMENKGSW